MTTVPLKHFSFLKPAALISCWVQIYSHIASFLPIFFYAIQFIAVLCIRVSIISSYQKKLRAHFWFIFKISEVIQRMHEILAENQKQVTQPTGCRSTVSKSTDKKTDLNSPDSCITSGSAQDSRNVTIDVGKDSRCAGSTCTQRKPDGNYQENVKERENCQTSDLGSANSAVWNGDLEPKVANSNPDPPSCKIVPLQASSSKIDVHGIRERIKKRKLDRDREMKLSGLMDNTTDGEAWIEKELENGIEQS